MRVEYINPFVNAALGILQEVVGSDISRGQLYLKSTSMEIQGVAALVGLAGEVEGRVLFDMTMKTALYIAGEMNGGEVFETMDEMARDTIQELANMIAARAVTELANSGFKFDLPPPPLFTGDNMKVSNNLKMEALIVPMELGEGGKHGRLDVNVAIRERS
jgi:chemotaxis protein CheX